MRTADLVARKLESFGLEVQRGVGRAGPMMAGGAFFDIRVTGKGAHGARHEAGVDAALAAAQIAVSLQSIVARNVPPVQTACCR